MDSNKTAINLKEEINHIQYNYLLKNIKSKFIFLKIFCNLQKNKSLKIMKYNKEIQNKLNVNIHNYKEYSEIYSLIEIELVPINNKFSKFININKEEKEYYQIFFNDNKKEHINKNHLDENDKVKKINIIINYQIKSFKDLFSDCICIESITFKKFYRIDISNMSGLFSGCYTIKKINLSKFNTINVTDMSYMFYNCALLTELNLSKLNTNNVNDMRFMFYNCSSLEKLNLSNFNTNNVTNMSHMFFYCILFKELDLTNFNTDKVTDMSYMFFHCSSLNELNISQFNIDKVTNMYSMFSFCSDKLKNKIKNQIKSINKEALE